MCLNGDLYDFQTNGILACNLEWVCVARLLLRFYSCARSVRFFDTNTRAIQLLVVVYNTNTRQLTSVQLLIEVYMSSDIRVTYTLDTTKIVVYQSRTDRVGFAPLLQSRSPTASSVSCACPCALQLL